MLCLTASCSHCRGLAEESYVDFDGVKTLRMAAPTGLPHISQSADLIATTATGLYGAGAGSSAPELQRLTGLALEYVRCGQAMILRKRALPSVFGLCLPLESGVLRCRTNNLEQIADRAVYAPSSKRPADAQISSSSLLTGPNLGQQLTVCLAGTTASDFVVPATESRVLGFG